ncbi:MAG: tRNA (adenosine(37)-N6)-dimethylallyltransferase MiaA [Alphaproteobacteria bacterium]|nr:tRNA (adenosine(37)-N6)-dimethylallyltransferase MiaA [Alphaproteobacteria bacterium]
MRPCLLIAGPTAAGKTALSLAAAERLNGEIINADSMQIYEGLHILTARPDAQEEARAPHHLFGTIAPDRRFSVGEWLDASLALIAEIRSRGRTPILVGGTGLYFNALTKGLAPVPEIDDAARERAEALINQQGFEALRAEALRADPLAAERVEPADRQRLQRIVEVFYTTGAALSSFWDKTKPALPDGEWRGLVLEPDRAQLYARIERRFDLMLEQGGLEEVAAFAERRLDPDLPAMKALGVPPLLAHLAGEMTLADAVEISKRDSRRYAKRQSTWFRNQNGSWPRITSLDSETAIAALETILEGD